MSRPELIAHRGWVRRHPENTLAAVRAAIEVGARFVEVDVQLAADGTPFLFHDRELERLCEVEGTFGERNAAGVAELSVAGERIPALDEAVELFAAHAGVHAFVELKRASVEAFGAEEVLEAVLPRLEPIAERCTLISFDLDVLRIARERCALPLGPVLESWSQRAYPGLAALEPDVVFCNVLRLPGDGPLEVPGGRLAVYEIDDPDLALQLHAKGAAMIETFAIGEMLAALGERA